MQKTRKSIAKRFKVTGTGKIKRRTPGFGNHNTGKKSVKRKRSARQDKDVAPGLAKQVRIAAPGKF